ncbi:MAG TPA: electron-transfer flavoprotein:ubiquinone oxidoreductase [Pseudobdellovibrionaceae bacterium]
MKPKNTKTILPLKFQPPLPIEKVILKEKPQDPVPLDVIFVGAGPAGLSGAIELAKLIANRRKQDSAFPEIQIGVMDKSQNLGEHCLSGAVVNPVAMKYLFPELDPQQYPFRGLVKREKTFFLTPQNHIMLPTPPTMRNDGYYVASLSEMVRWLGQQAAALGVHILTGFPVGALLTDGQKILGVRTVAAGQNRDGTPGSGFTPPADLSAQCVVLSEGTRGLLAQCYQSWKGIKSPSPQIYALGVKELWRVKKPLEEIIHTLGWPLSRRTFGGSFFYPMGADLVALGLVVGLDYQETNTDTHQLLQQMKAHPFFRSYLKGGELMEWGAKTIPEGGFHALPEKLHGDGLLIIGDAAGFVNVPALKGIHYAMQSGIMAAQTIFAGLIAGDLSSKQLSKYDDLIRSSQIVKDLYKVRNMREAFHRGFYSGVIKAGLMTLSSGAFPDPTPNKKSDAHVLKTYTKDAMTQPPGSLSKVDGVFHAGNKTRDDIPNHLLVGQNIPQEVAEFYAALCPAGVYEVKEGRLHINAPNCVDCKATDDLGPRWTPREGGSGTRYQQM